MGEFFDKLREVESDFNVLDKVVVLSFGKTLFSKPESIHELWPDAEPLIEGSSVSTFIELAFDRENAAKGRDATNVAEFFAFVVDALVKATEETAAQQGNRNP